METAASLLLLLLLLLRDEVEGFWACLEVVQLMLLLAMLFLLL